MTTIIFPDATPADPIGTTTMTCRPARTLWRKAALGSWRVLVALVAVGAALAPAAAGAAQARASIHLKTAVKIGPPPDTPNPGAVDDFLLAVACSRAGFCTAGGWFDGPEGQAMVVNESNGHWRAPRSLVMPPQGNFIPSGQVNGLACTGPGNCVAVGTYFSGQPSHGNAFIAVQSGGTWSIARTIKLPTGASVNAGSELRSVACTARGSCVAVGDFGDQLGRQLAMRVTESNGKWAQASRLGQPVNAGSDPKASVNSVSCNKAGTCVAVGNYTDSGGNAQAVVFSRSGGKWHSGAQVKLPANAATNPHAALISVSCPVTGSCAAVGGYQNKQADVEPMAMTVSGGKLSAARALTLVPAGAAAQPTPSLFSVACPAAGACLATGQYKTSTGAFAPMIVMQSAGKWTGKTRIVLPSDASTSSKRFADARGVSCTSNGYCSVVGFYQAQSSVSRGFAAITQ